MQCCVCGCRSVSGAVGGWSCSCFVYLALWRFTLRGAEVVRGKRGKDNREKKLAVEEVGLRDKGNQSELGWDSAGLERGIRSEIEFGVRRGAS